MKTALLYSGGLDSVLLRMMYPAAVPVHVEYGQPYGAAERAAMVAQRQLFGWGPPVIVEARLPVALPDGHVAHRNLALIVAAAAWTGADEVLIGGVRGETSLDKSRAFMRAAGKALRRSEGVHGRVRAPLAARTKSEHLRGLVVNGGYTKAQAVLDVTTSCYAAEWDGAEIGCGECLACFRKWVAVTNAGLTARFKTPPRSRVIRKADARYMLRAPVREWPGIVANHLDARRALAAG